MSARTTIPVWVYTPKRGDKKLVEALIACRGDWLCAHAIIEAGVATGDSIVRMNWRRFMCEAEVDPDRLERVVRVAKLVAMASPTRITANMVDERVLSRLVRFLDRLARTMQDIDENAYRITDYETYERFLTEMIDALVDTARAAAERRGVVEGKLGIYNVNYRYRISGENGLTVDIKFVSGLEGAWGEAKGKVDGCEFRLRMQEPHSRFGAPDGFGIASLSLRCNGAIDWGRLRETLLKTVLAIARRVRRDEDVAPPEGVEIRTEGSKPVSEYHIDYWDVRSVYNAWYRLGVPARFLSVLGNPPEMLVPGPAPKTFFVMYEAIGPDGDTYLISFSGLPWPGVTISPAETVIPRRISEIKIDVRDREGKQLASIELDGSISFEMTNWDVYTKIAPLVMLAAFDDVRMLDRLSLYGRVHAKIKTRRRGMAVAEKEFNGPWRVKYILETPRGTVTIQRTEESIIDVIDNLVHGRLLRKIKA